MAKQDSYEEFKSTPPPLGNHNSRVQAFIDLGTQKPKNPAHKATGKVMVAIEMVETGHDFGKGYEEPFVKYKEFTPNLGDNISTGKPTLYRTFVQQLLNKVVVKGEKVSRLKLVGLPIIATIEEEEDSKDPQKTYVNLTKFKSVPKEVGAEFPKLRNPKIYFELPDQGEESDINCKYAPAGEKAQDLHWTDCFLKLHKWQQKKIMESPEFIRACAVYGVAVIETEDGRMFQPVASKTKKSAPIGPETDDEPPF